MVRRMVLNGIEFDVFIYFSVIRVCVIFGLF